VDPITQHQLDDGSGGVTAGYTQVSYGPDGKVELSAGEELVVRGPKPDPPSITQGKGIVPVNAPGSRDSGGSNREGGRGGGGGREHGAENPTEFISRPIKQLAAALGLIKVPVVWVFAELGATVGEISLLIPRGVNTVTEWLGHPWGVQLPPWSTGGLWGEMHRDISQYGRIELREYRGEEE
jgi:hypothetical protein